jgi:hypothetical protein
MWKSVKTGSYEGRGIKCVHMEASRHILTEDFGMIIVETNLMTRDSSSSLMSVLTAINSWSKGKTFASRGITDNESWCLQYNPEMKCQSKQCKTSMAPIPEKVHMPGSPVKTVLMLS